VTAPKNIVADGTAGATAATGAGATRAAGNTVVAPGTPTPRPPIAPPPTGGSAADASPGPSHRAPQLRQNLSPGSVGTAHRQHATDTGRTGTGGGTDEDTSGDDDAAARDDAGPPGAGPTGVGAGRDDGDAGAASGVGAPRLPTSTRGITTPVFKGVPDGGFIHVGDGGGSGGGPDVDNNDAGGGGAGGGGDASGIDGSGGDGAGNDATSGDDGAAASADGATSSDDDGTGASPPSRSDVPQVVQTAVPASLYASQAEQTSPRNNDSASATAAPDAGNAKPQTSQRAFDCPAEPQDGQSTAHLPVSDGDLRDSRQAARRRQLRRRPAGQRTPPEVKRQRRCHHCLLSLWRVGRQLSPDPPSVEQSSTQPPSQERRPR
jgi:hypothetical protein